MPRRARILSAAAVALAIVVVVLIVRGGGDDPQGQTVKGEPTAGFPLRGSLADVQDEIDAAVAAWRKDIQRDRDDDSESARDSADDEPGRPPTPDDDISVLWIGHTGDRDEDVAILTGGDYVVELTRGFNDHWFVRDRSVVELDFGGDTPISAGDSVLVPAGADWTYADAGYFAPLDPSRDGLFHTDGPSGQGFVLPEIETVPETELADAYVFGVGPVSLTGDELTRMRKTIADGHARALWTAISDAREHLADDPRMQPGWLDTRRAPYLQIVWTGSVPNQPDGVIVALDAGVGRSMSLGYAKEPGPESRSEDKNEGAVSLGVGAGQPDSAVGSGFLVRDSHPYLVLAGVDVTSLHALIGDEQIDRDAPAAIVDVDRFFTGHNTRDTVVFGRDARGDVVAPLPPG